MRHRLCWLLISTAFLREREVKAKREVLVLIAAASAPDAAIVICVAAVQRKREVERNVGCLPVV